MTRALGIVPLLFNRDLCFKRVPDEHRFNEPKPVISISESRRVDVVRGEADADGKDESSMSDALAKWSLPGKLSVHVMRKEVSRVAGVDDDIGLCDGSPRGDPLRPGS